ncbi:MAG: choice-of-anchor J domain-containing protein [Bacteroidales bacterium]
MNKKQKISLLGVLLLTIGFFPGLFAEEITIGVKGSETTRYAPVDYYYKYSKSQILYRADELNLPAGSKITSLTFEYKSKLKSIEGDLYIDMGEIDQNQFTEKVYVAGLDRYYAGPHNMCFTKIDVDTIVTYVLDTEYIYEGGNLVIDFHNTGNQRTGYISSLYFYAAATTGNTVLYNGSDSKIEGTPSLSEKRPVLTLAYIPGVVPDTAVLGVGVSSLDFGFIPRGSTAPQTLSVKNKGKADLAIAGLEGLKAPFTATLPEESIAFGNTGMISFNYTPEKAGQDTCDILIKSNGGEAALSLIGKAYSENAYFEHFEGLSMKPVPSGWRCSNNAYDNCMSTGTDGYEKSRYLGCTEPGDTIYSPVVKGKVFFYIKRKSSSSTLSLYKVSAITGETTVIEENIPLSDDWVKYETIISEAGTRLAFSMGTAMMDEFFAENAILPAYDVELISKPTNRPSNFMSIEEGALSEVTFQVRNMGTQPLQAGAYSIRTFFSTPLDFKLMYEGVEMPQQILTATPALALDETVIVKAQMLVSLAEKEKVSGLSFFAAAVNDDDSTNNIVCTGNNITILPKIGKLTMPTGSRLDTPLDFGVFKGEKTIAVKLQNDGIDELTISEYRFETPGKFSIDEDALTVIPAKGSIEIKVKLSGDAGIYTDSLLIAHNGSSESQHKLYMTGRILSKAALFEDFEKEEFPPLFWTQTASVWKRYTSSLTYIYEGKACLNKTSSSADTLITPQLNIHSGENLCFYGRSAGSGAGKVNVLYSKDKKNWVLLESFTVYTLYVQKCVVFPEEAAGEYYIGFTGENVYVDFIYGPEVIYTEHRLEIESFTGKEKGMVNQSQNFEFTFRNTGINDEPAEAYTVLLMDGNEKVAEFVSEPIAFTERKTLQSSWTPYTPGKHKLYAALQFNGTVITSDTLFVNVSEERAETETMVGTMANAVTNAPWSTNYKRSAAEVIYTADELNLNPGSRIIRMTLPYIATDTISFKVSAWIANTEVAQIDAVRKISIEGMTRVFEQVHFFESEGASLPNYLEIDFEVPFEYTGKNLSVVIALEANRYKAIKFYKNDTEAGRSLYIRTDKTTIEAPGMFDELDGMLGKYYPTMIFTCAKDPVIVSGTVVSAGLPVADADLSLTAGHIRYLALTDEQGAFALPVYQLPHKYELRIAKEGFETYSDSIALEDASVELPEITLVSNSQPELPPFTLSLHVEAITQENLEGATVYLENKEYGLLFDRTLDSEGNCVIGDVYPGTHILRIEKEGLAAYQNDTLIINESMTLNIVLKENVRKPYALSSTVSYDPRSGDSDLTLSWNKETDYFFDDFESYEMFAIEFAPWSGIDGDNAPAARLQGDYANRGLKQYAMIFNPLTVNPSLWYDYPVLRPYSGKQYAAFVRTENGTKNNDWLISPKIKVGVDNIVSFMAKAGDRYAERFVVAVSTTGTEMKDFKALTPGNYEEVTYKEWKDVTYSLAAYEGQEVYIAIQYVSQAYFMLMVDDFYVGPVQQKGRVKRIAASVQNAQERFVVSCDGDSIDTTYNTYYNFRNLAAGKHTLGVKSVYRVSQSEVATTEVTVADKSEFAKLTIEVACNGGDPENIPVSIINMTTGEEYVEPLVSQKASLPYLMKGAYLLNIEDNRYSRYSESITLNRDTVIVVNLEEQLHPVQNLTADYAINADNLSMNVVIKWNQDLGWSDNFESYADFAQQFGDWTVLDLDKMPGYGVQLGSTQISFPGVGQPMGGMIFNAAATTPSMYEDGAIRAVEGDKSVIFFSPQAGQANDWLIAPKQHIYENYVLRFYAKSYLEMYSETFRVGVCTDADPATFTEIDRVTAADQWVLYEIDLSAYAGQEIYPAINYVSYDKFMFLVDLVYVGPAEESSLINTGARKYHIYLNGVKHDETADNTYTFTGLPIEACKVGVKAAYDSGVSELNEVDVTPVISGVDQEGLMPAIWVRTSGQQICVDASAGDAITVFNSLGQMIERQVMQSDRFFTKSLTPGIYHIQVRSDRTIKTYEMVIR